MPGETIAVPTIANMRKSLSARRIPVAFRFRTQFIRRSSNNTAGAVPVHGTNVSERVRLSGARVGGRRRKAALAAADQRAANAARSQRGGANPRVIAAGDIGRCGDGSPAPPRTPSTAFRHQPRRRRPAPPRSPEIAPRRSSAINAQSAATGVVANDTGTRRSDWWSPTAATCLTWPIRPRHVHRALAATDFGLLGSQRWPASTARGWSTSPRRG